MLTDLVAAARRHLRPEAEIAWKFAAGPGPAALAPWPANAYHSVTPMASYVVQVAVRNIGGPAGGPVLCNVVAPAVFRLDAVDGPVARHSTNEVVGDDPEQRVTYHAIEFAFEPDTWYSAQFVVGVPGDAEARTGGRPQGLLFDVAHPRLNATGVSALPVPQLHEQAVHGRDILRLAATWPPTVHRTVMFERIVAQDHHVQCTAGQRRSLRTLIVGDPPDMPGPVARRTFTPPEPGQPLDPETLSPAGRAVYDTIVAPVTADEGPQ